MRDFPRLPEDIKLPELVRRLNLYLSAPQGGSTVITNLIVTGTMKFDPDNTHDVGYWNGSVATARRPRTVYAATSVVSPRFGTITNDNVVIVRNTVPQITLSSLLATFAGAVAVTTYASIGATPATAGDLRMEYGDNIQFRNQLNTGNIPGFGVATAGVGTPNPTNNFFIGGVGANNLHFLVNDGTKWLMEAVSPYALLPWDNFGSGNTNRQDIGASTMRLRSVYLGTALKFPNNPTGLTFLNAAGAVELGALTVTTANYVRLGGTNPSGIEITVTGVGSESWYINRSAGAGFGAYDLIPGTDNTRNFGGTSYRIARGHFTNLSVGSLQYIWPTSQAANRLLRNTGPGTLAWSQVDLSTDVTGALAGGTVPAAQVTAGTFGTGSYLFDSNLTVGTAPADPAVSNYWMWDNSAGRMISLGTEWAQYRYGGAPQFNAYYAGGTSGSPVVPAVNTVMFQLAATGWDTVTGKFGTSTRLRMQGVAAEAWVSGSAEGTGYKLLLTGIGGTTTSEVIRWGPGPWTSASTTASVYPDGQLILDRFGTPGIGNYGAALAFTGIANSLRRYVALVPRQTTADVDQMGLSVWVHPNATNTAAMEEIVRFSRSGDLHTEFFGNVFATRYFGTGTAHVAGDYALSAGWGTTASVSAVAARDTGGRVTVTCNGASIAANPTVTLTFKDGTWTTIPAVVVTRGDGTAPTTGFWAMTTASATAPVFTFFGTPVAGSTYTFDFVVMGK